MFSFVFFLLIELPIDTSDFIDYQNILTVIGDKNIKRRSSIITQSFSNLSINGPFYCHVTWMDDKQSIDIYTDENMHPYVLVTIQKDTLKITMQSDANYIFTEMTIHLHLYSTIKEIFLAGISSFQSMNALKTNNQLTIHTEDTSSIVLQLDVLNLDALFLSAGTSQLMGHVTDVALIKYNGVGDVDASQLYCKRVDVAANGLGTIWITGTDECIIKAEGVSTVKYNCSHLNYTQLTGLAKIISV